MQNKLNTYIGFAIKSGDIVYGQDNILRQKNIPLVLIEEGVSQNTQQKLKVKFKNVYVLNTFAGLNLKGRIVAILNNELAKKCIEIICENKGANSIE